MQDFWSLDIEQLYCLACIIIRFALAQQQCCTACLMHNSRSGQPALCTAHLDDIRLDCTPERRHTKSLPATALFLLTVMYTPCQQRNRGCHREKLQDMLHGSNNKYKHVICTHHVTEYLLHAQFANIKIVRIPIGTSSRRFCLEQSAANDLYNVWWCNYQM